MRKKKQFKSLEVIIVSFGHLLHDLYSSSLSVMIPLLVNKLGISLSMAGMLDVIKNSPSLLTPFMGLAVDRMRIKYIVIIAPSTTAIIMSLLGLAPTYGVAVILMFLSGISATLFHIPSPVIVKDLSGGKIGTGMSYYMLGGELSRTLGPILISAIITIWGLEGSWRLMPFGIISSILLYFKLKDYEGTTSVSKDKGIVSTRSAVKELVPLLSAIGGYNFFMLAMKIAVTLYLPAYIVDQGRSLVSASFLLAVLQVSGAAGTFFAGSISDRIGRKTTLYISGLACPVLMWLFLATGDALAAPLLAGLGFFLFASGPIALALVQDSGSAFPSFANGLYMTVNFVIRSLIVFLVGFFAERLGFAFTYKITVFWAIGVFPFIYFIPEKKRKIPRGEITSCQTSE